MTHIIARWVGTPNRHQFKALCGRVMLADRGSFVARNPTCMKCAVEEVVKQSADAQSAEAP